jgi:uncharacterized membrane protein YgdD (TMEM256/DUF423 family)
MAQFALLFAALSGLTAVALGAFGAHALRARLDSYAMGVFETAVQYQFYHAWRCSAPPCCCCSSPASMLLRSSAWLFIIGMLIFSGSLYVLSITGMRWLGAVTPLGGLAFIAGWACLAAAGWKLL